MTVEECPVCQWGPNWSPHTFPLDVEEPRQGIREIVCPRCGPFRHAASDRLERLAPEDRVAVSAFVKRLQLRGRQAPLLSLHPVTRRKNSIRLEDIRAVIPRNITAIQNEIVLTLAAMGSYGNRLELFSAEHGGQLSAPIAFTFDTRELLFHLDQLIEEGVLHWVNAIPQVGSLREAATVSGLNGVDLTLRRAGWLRVEELQRGSAENPHQAFVAMWFDRSLEAAYHDGFAPAIRDAGYEAVQLAFIEHNDDIDDRIVAEIRRSRFLVADFTGGRGGVYFEAGFALGVGKPVVFTCRRDWFDKHGVHFDTEHRNHILWNDAAELRDKLRARIEATVPIDRD